MCSLLFLEEGNINSVISFLYERKKESSNALLFYSFGKLKKFAAILFFSVSTWTD